MALRNIDMVKKLRYEIGRYEKKVADQEKELAWLRGELKRADRGSMDTQALVDGVLTAIVLEHGEDAVDPDDDGKVLGKRLTFRRFDVADMRKKYEIHARVDKERDSYVLGVAARREEDAEDGGRRA